MLGELEPAFLIQGVERFFGSLATLVRILAELVCTVHRVELPILKPPRASQKDKNLCRFAFPDARHLEHRGAFTLACIVAGLIVVLVSWLFGVAL
jgi:hypothetical protein